jgi:hypothetical protein
VNFMRMPTPFNFLCLYYTTLRLFQGNVPNSSFGA